MMDFGEILVTIFPYNVPSIFLSNTWCQLFQKETVEMYELLGVFLPVAMIVFPVMEYSKISILLENH